jgi:hypothetical protein
LGAFFDRELERLDLVVAAPSKVARRAWYDAIDASMIRCDVTTRVLWGFLSWSVIARSERLDNANRLSYGGCGSLYSAIQCGMGGL